jgi:PleD family two-component response regulator
LHIPPIVVVVEPDAERLAMLVVSLTNVARVVGCPDFQAARARLLIEPPDLLIANIRLREYNGIHLVMLAPASTRSVVYMDPEDLVLLREAQKAGAFVESPERLVLALPSYVGSALRMRDRRDLQRFDRRSTARGGRRAADAQVSV